MEEGLNVMSKITNKTFKNYDRISRYSVFPYYYNRLDNKYMYGLTTHLKTDNVSYVNHYVKQGDTFDSIALYYYNNPTYYWVIMDFNKLQDPFKEPEVGTVLKIPTFSSIEFDI